jgi:competence protein ComEC
MSRTRLGPYIIAAFLLLAFALAGTTATLSTVTKAKADTVYITDNGKCYHRAGCKSLCRSKIAISRAKAKEQGYKACRLCHP